MKHANNFNEWLNEASLEGNIGLPGEGENGPNYRSRVEQKAGMANREFAAQNRDKLARFMQFVAEVHQIQRGKEKQLEELAEKTIRTLFGSIIDGVELDIKMPTSPAQIKDMMSETPEESDQIEFEKIEDEETINAIQKRKLANNITQGEAKNTKLCLNLDEVAEGLIEIFGEKDGTRMLQLLNDITATANFFDWNIPLEIQKDMWKARSGFAGSVKVEWKDADQDAEDLAQKILNDIENGEDITDNEDAEELFSEGTPVVHALGSDFAMLLHETVKGIYELIAAVGIPEDSELSEIVIMNTDTLYDELEDLRYGPQMAADLRDFINEFKENNEFENLRARFWGKMMELEPKEFLRLFHGILLTRFKDSELTDAQKVEVSRTKSIAQTIIDNIKEELENYYNEPSEYAEEEEEDEPNFLSSPAEQGEQNLSKDQLRDAIIDAYQAGDMEEVSRLEKLLGESILFPSSSFSRII